MNIKPEYKMKMNGTDGKNAGRVSGVKTSLSF